MADQSAKRILIVEDEFLVALHLEDLLTGTRYPWRGARNYVRLDPAERAGHILVVRA